jgi:thioredoxin 1
MINHISTPHELQKYIDETNRSHKILIAYFFANWCGPCKQIKPKIEQLSQNYSDRLEIVKINVDDAYDIVNNYKVSAMPTFIFFKNGNIYEKRVIGANFVELVNVLNNII